MYRLSAHGNIIAPPGVPLHFPEHEAIEKFGAPEEYEAALQGDPVPALPRPARRRRHAHRPRRPTRIADDASATRCRPRSTFGLESPFPDVESALEYVYA